MPKITFNAAAHDDPGLVSLSISSDEKELNKQYDLDNGFCLELILEDGEKASHLSKSINVAFRMYEAAKSDAGDSIEESYDIFITCKNGENNIKFSGNIHYLFTILSNEGLLSPVLLTTISNDSDAKNILESSQKYAKEKYYHEQLEMEYLLQSMQNPADSKETEIMTKHHTKNSWPMMFSPNEISNSNSTSELIMQIENLPEDQRKNRERSFNCVSINYRSSKFNRPSK